MINIELAEDVTIVDNPTLQKQPTYKNSVPKNDIVSGIPTIDVRDRSQVQSLLLRGYDGDYSESLSNNAFIMNDDTYVTECGLFGTFPDILVDDESTKCYLNTHDPFCFLTVGVQGSGKSHTLSCVLENCLIPCLNVVTLKQPMSALVLHFDQSPTNVCEATGLIEPSPIYRGLPCLPKEKMIVLVSPNNCPLRTAYYHGYCDVRPLLFPWNSLSAGHIKKIMRISDGENQLYISSMLQLISDYQREDKIPEFEQFKKEVLKLCNVQGQSGPLLQRFRLLENMVRDSTKNERLAANSMDLYAACRPETLVVVDLTDPMMDKESANGIFQVLVEQYRTMSIIPKCGKLLALDEAHKFMDGASTDGLSSAIVDVARTMRHDEMRIAISTQNPKALASELIDLVSTCVMHSFHSKDWFQHLSNKLSLKEENFELIQQLKRGEGLMFCSRASLSDKANESRLIVERVRIRERLTADRGATKSNKVEEI
jgi:hypothetical protein